jgi:hypothetical protein
MAAKEAGCKSDNSTEKGVGSVRELDAFFYGNGGQKFRENLPD